MISAHCVRGAQKIADYSLVSSFSFRRQISNAQLYYLAVLSNMPSDVHISRVKKGLVSNKPAVSLGVNSVKSCHLKDDFNSVFEIIDDHL